VVGYVHQNSSKMAGFSVHDNDLNIEPAIVSLGPHQVPVRLGREVCEARSRSTARFTRIQLIRSTTAAQEEQV
jgi:hypothetical protein